MTHGLSKLLADSYTLYLKTHNYHWNVTGPMFLTLHELFEVQYTELAAAVDVIAERIRALGSFAPATLKSFAQLTTVTEELAIPTANDMIKNLLDAHEIIIKHGRSVLTHDSIQHDDVTAGLITDRLEVHEKTAWMLRSLLV
ncbi:MAG: DNA starvation/stationary phase protection protein [Proteobacteria bacterium]|nr:DNA starvation/stationary phase protection protein [Pseudomonadota bacterium]